MSNNKISSKEFINILTKIEINLAEIGVHVDEIKKDIQELKQKHNDVDKKVEALEHFKDKLLGAAIIAVPVCSGITAILVYLLKASIGL